MERKLGVSGGSMLDLFVAGIESPFSLVRLIETGSIQKNGT